MAAIAALPTICQDAKLNKKVRLETAPPLSHITRPPGEEDHASCADSEFDNPIARNENIVIHLNQILPKASTFSTKHEHARLFHQRGTQC